MKNKKIRLSSYLKPYWFMAAISPIMMIGEVLGDLCLPYLMSYIVDFGIADGGLEKMAKNRFATSFITLIFGDDYTRMNVIVAFGVLMLLIVLIGGFFGIFCAYTSAKASQGFGHDLRCDTYKRVMSLSIEQTDKFTTGSLVTRMTNDISMLTQFVQMLLRMIVRAPMFIIGGTVMLLALNVDFGIVLLCSLPVLITTLILILSRAVPLFSKGQKKLDKVNSVVQENVSGARVVKAYVREDYENERFDSANVELRDVNLRVLTLMAYIGPVLTVIQNAAIIAIIYIGGIKIDAEIGGMSVGTVMAAVSYVTNVISSVMMVTMVFQSISRAAASAERVREVLTTEPAISGGDKDAEIEDIAVEFKNVSFSYPSSVGAPVLCGVDLKIKRGETFAIVGDTGSGKTSLVSLIPRFYDATDGEVLVGGLGVKEYKLSALRKKIGFVMQRSELFSGSIRENIRWGKDSASENEILDALTVASADGFVSAIDGGMNASIAEKGTSLSGGQKQRLSIARAAIRKPEILILDDSTSALDLSTEARVRAAIKEKMTGTTVIMIAQRIASVKDADRIAVIENGRISACGTHGELMATSEAYRDIYESQMRAGGAENE